MSNATLTKAVEILDDYKHGRALRHPGEVTLLAFATYIVTREGLEHLAPKDTRTIAEAIGWPSDLATKGRQH